MNWVWTAWLLFLISSFAILEAYALNRNKTTLSRYIWRGAQAWPLLPFVFGLMCGGLAVHFFWRWCD